MKMPFLWYGLSILLLFACANDSGVHQDEGPDSNVSDTLVIQLNGSGYERGLQHGQLLKDQVTSIVADWKANIARFGVDPEAVLDTFFQYAAFDEAIRTWAPDLYEEIGGIADGSGQAFRDIMVLNLLDEFWVFLDDRTLHHCSGIGMPAMNGQDAYVAQNMDLEGYTDGYQVVFRLPATEDQPEQLILSHAGFIGLNGLNSSGVGLCVNTLMQLKASRTGLPVAFIIRKILSMENEEQILDFVQKVPHASGQNYIIGIRGKVYDYEASAGQVVRFDPGLANGAVYHTNHPVANKDLKSWYMPDPEAGETEPDNSEIRFASLEKRINPLSGPSAETIKDALRSKDDPRFPVCRNMDERGGTFASVVFTTSGQPRFEWTIGSPDKDEYRYVPFSR